jgi:hypothetical protein
MNNELEKQYLTVDFVISIVVIVLAGLQGPVLYYYTFGLLSLLVIPLYVVVGLSLTLILFFRYLRRNSPRDRFTLFAPYFGFLVGTGSLFAEKPIEYLDWTLRQSTREEIVQMVKNGTLRPNVSYNDVICKLGGVYIPPISNGGNEIAIIKGDNRGYTIEFFINRGFLDHYSAFVYTDDPEKIMELNDWVSGNNVKQGNRIMKNNWYRVSY